MGRHYHEKSFRIFHFFAAFSLNATRFCAAAVFDDSDRDKRLGAQKSIRLMIKLVKKLT